MPRAREPNRDKAVDLYKSGMKLVEIASQLNVPPGTVRRWKCTDKWDSEQDERSESKSERSVKANGSKEEVVAEEVKQVISNNKLTDKQRLFCLLFVKSFNATKSYQKAYGCSYETATSISYRLLANVGVKEEIQRLKQERMTRSFMSEQDIFQKYMDIAYADITDYVEFGNEDIEFTDDVGNERIATVSHVNVKNDYEVDGTLISEVSKGKDGVRVKLADRMKALDWLSDHMDMATTEQKAKIGLINVQRDKLIIGEDANAEEEQKKVSNISSILEQMTRVKDGDISE